MIQRRSYTYVEASSDYVVHVERGRSRSSFAVSRLALYCAAGSLALFVFVLLGAASYLFFHDDILAGLIERETEMQYSYEDRLAAARLRLDQVASRQFIDQDGVEGKVQDLVVREAMLETRAAVVAQLVERTAQEVSEKTPVAKASLAGAVQPRTPPALLPAPKAFQNAIDDAPADGKPHPEGFDLRLGRDGSPPAGLTTQTPALASARRGVDRAALDSAKDRGFERSPSSLAYAADPGLPIQARLDRLALSLDHIERDQATRIKRIARPALAAASRLRQAFDEAGLRVDRYVAKAKAQPAPGVGGPYMAADLEGGGGSFDRDLTAAQSAVATIDGLRRALPNVPLRKPLSGDLQITSGFGYRTDPFLGRPALHSGVDLRQDYGEPVRATAGGVVTVAGPGGGYGNMVEINHGGGLSTRYGHLSQIAVAPGQLVAAGAVIGKVGSSGRSTGPHLHYEIRSDGEAVDPARFLKAAATLGATR